MKFTAMTMPAAIVLASLGAAVQAQDPAPPGAAVEVRDGSSVYGSDGKPVGKVVASRDDAVLIDTGAHRIPVAAAALAKGQNGATLPLTRAALDAQYEKTMAQQAARVDAALTVGAPVKTADAKSLGTVSQVQGDNVTLQGDAGNLVLPRKYFVMDKGGSLIVPATMEQLRQAAASSAQGGS